MGFYKYLASQIYDMFFSRITDHMFIEKSLKIETHSIFGIYLILKINSILLNKI